MSGAGIVPDAVPDVLPGPLPALLAAHSALAERLLTAGGVPAGEREALVRAVMEAGVAVPPGPGRDALRNVLFFWSGDQASRGERTRAAPPPALAAYDPGSAEPGGGGALPGWAKEAGADALRSRPPSALAAAAASFAAALTSRTTLGIASGAGPEGPRAGTPGGPAAMLASAAQAAREEDARQAVRLSAVARQWRLSDGEHKPGYLLNDRRTLADAARYAGRDPDIAALVAASTAALDRSDGRRRRAAWTLAVTAIVALAALAAVLFLLFHGARTERDALRRASAEWTRTRDQTRQSAADAVDALRRGDLEPLEALLRHLGGADDADLALLRVTPAAADAPWPELAGPELAGSAPPPTTAAAGPAGAPGATAAPGPAAGPTCTGHLWLGTKGAGSRLAGQADPGALKPGDSGALDPRGAIRLRAAWPGDAPGHTNRQIGLVPAGGAFTVVGGPRTFPSRPDDVWAEVRVPRVDCSTVFLQYVGTADRRDAVLAALRDLDVQVPPAERVASAAGLAEVRVFAADDLPVANQVAAALARFNGGIRLAVVSLTKLATKPAPGTMEVWLDLSR